MEQTEPLPATGSSDPLSLSSISNEIQIVQFKSSKKHKDSSLAQIRRFHDIRNLKEFQADPLRAIQTHFENELKEMVCDKTKLGSYSRD